MPDVDDAYLETLLREHLTAKLNGQLGRPMAGFFAHAAHVERSVVDRPQGEALRLAQLPDPASSESQKRSESGSGRVKRFHRLDGWLLGLGGAALAASLAALWAAPAVFRGRPPVIPIRAMQPTPVPAPPELARSNSESPDGTATYDLAGSSQSPLMHWVQSRTLDEGTVVLDDPDHSVPARKLRQQQLEHTQWYDPAQRERVEMTVPRENIKFVEMDTY